MFHLLPDLRAERFSGSALSINLLLQPGFEGSAFLQPVWFAAAGFVWLDGCLALCQQFVDGVIPGSLLELMDGFWLDSLDGSKTDALVRFSGFDGAVCRGLPGSSALFPLFGFNLQGTVGPVVCHTIPPAVSG
jgi:hypothetical protein